MENDEKKYEDVIKSLKGLKEVKAPENFEADLQRRINSEKAAKKEKKSFWQNIFRPSRLVPSLGLVTAVIVIFFVVDSNSEDMDNPFLIEPRVREDVVAVTDYDEFEAKQEELSKQKSLKKDEPVLEKRRDENEVKTSDDKMVTGREKSNETEGLSDQSKVEKEQSITTGAFSASVETTEINITHSPEPNVSEGGAASEIVTGQSITKEELNFRQIQLSEEEQKVVDQLRTQNQSLEEPKKSQK